jgi:hypothetical protein
MEPVETGQPTFEGRPVFEWFGDLDADDTETQRCAVDTVVRWWASVASNDQRISWEVYWGIVNDLRKHRPSAVLLMLSVPNPCRADRIAELVEDAKKLRPLRTVSPIERIRHARTADLPQLRDELAETQDEAVQVEIVRALRRLDGVREALPTLLRLLREGTTPVREVVAAVLATAELSGLEAEDALRTARTDDSPTVQAWACQALWRLTGRSAEVIPYLRTMLQQRPRLFAARLLCTMKEQATAALPELLALRWHSDWITRLQAVRALLHLPCPDEEARSVLEWLQNDPHPTVRLYVEEAIARRTGRPTSPA